MLTSVAPGSAIPAQRLSCATTSAGRPACSWRRALRRILIAAVGSGVLGLPCAAQTTKPSTGSGSNCASLGEGFVRAPGSDTCVRMRGAVRAEGFSGGTVSSAPGGGGATDLSNATGGSGASSATTDPWKQTR